MIDKALESLGFSECPITGFLQNANREWFNPKEKTAFLKALKMHGNQSKAAHDLGFPFPIVAWHLRKDPRFLEAFQETLLEMKHRLEGELYKAGLGGKSKEAKIWLEAHFPEDYRATGGKGPKKTKDDGRLDSLYEQLK